MADTFIQIWKNAESIDFDRDTLKEYIVCTARNISINRYRKLKKMPMTELFEDERPVGPVGDDILDSLINRESIEEVKRIVMRMPEPKREIVTRRYFLFENVREIAMELNLSSKQVMNQLYQAKLLIRNRLEGWTR